MTDPRATLGRQGEDLVARYLESRGCRIVARNWRIKGGEIDLVADTGDEIVFVEVKTRRGNGYGYPEEAVTYAKRRRLRFAAMAFMDRHGLQHRRFRIDVASVTLPAFGKPLLRHFRSAVAESG